MRFRARGLLLFDLDQGRDAAQQGDMQLGDFVILAFAVALAGYAALMFAPKR